MDILSGEKFCDAQVRPLFIRVYKSEINSTKSVCFQHAVVLYLGHEKGVFDNWNNGYISFSLFMFAEE